MIPRESSKIESKLIDHQDSKGGGDYCSIGYFLNHST